MVLATCTAIRNRTSAATASKAKRPSSKRSGADSVSSVDFSLRGMACILSGVMLEVAARVGLAIFVVAGYLSAYRRAKAAALTTEVSPIKRAASVTFCVIMALSAAYALCANWDGPFLPWLFASLIGVSVNVVSFYVGCVGALAMKQTNTKTQ